MQTFLITPNAGFTFLASCAYTASILDDQRLNKQITEAGQIIDAIVSGPTNRTRALYHHPATQAWLGSRSTKIDRSESLESGEKSHSENPTQKYLTALRVYRYILHHAWTAIRGGQYEVNKTEPILTNLPQNLDFSVPWWFNDPMVVRSHALSLMRKDYKHYSMPLREWQNNYLHSTMEWGDILEFTYIWPCEKNGQHYYQIKLNRDWFHCEAANFDFTGRALMTGKAV